MMTAAAIMTATAMIAMIKTPLPPSELSPPETVFDDPPEDVPDKASDGASPEGSADVPEISGVSVSETISEVALEASSLEVAGSVEASPSEADISTAAFL